MKKISTSDRRIEKEDINGYINKKREMFLMQVNTYIYTYIGYTMQSMTKSCVMEAMPKTTLSFKDMVGLYSVESRKVA